jgi:alpha-tubulin suppressor-like RCC1 family protein
MSKRDKLNPESFMKKRNLIQICLSCAVLLQATTSGAQPVTKISGGGGHSLFLKSDGSLWGMGRNFDGELGDGTYGYYPFFGTNRPEQLIVSNVTAIAAGGLHSLFLQSDGSLWGMGRNYEGQLGDGTYAYPYLTNHPVRIVTNNVTAIVAGSLHSLFLKGGTLWAMGYNNCGQLGDGTTNNVNQPEQIVASGVTTIAGGYQHSLFLKSDGSLWAMGDNEYGQLGDGTYNITNLPEQIVASNVTAIAAGFGHSLFLKSDGSLWAMGLNSNGQLGDGTTNNINQPELIVASNVMAITAGGSYHSLFLKSDGSLWVMGWNQFGQLGDGTYNATNRPEQIVPSNVTAIAAGGGHSLFIKSDGSLWAMGRNDSEQLGDGTSVSSTNRPELIVVGPPGYNQISGQLLSGSNVQLSFVGIAGTNYALDRTFNLTPPNWVPQVTNPAGADGVLVSTNTPDPTTNNFWRIRSVP